MISNTWAQLDTVKWRVRKTSEEESRSRMEWVEKNVRSDLRQRVTARVKGKVYKVEVRPAMLFWLQTVALTKRQEAEMEVAELKMLRFSLRVTRMENIRNGMG